MNEITLSLTIDEIQSIQRALSKFPFEQVAGLIVKLEKQTSPQIAALQSAVSETEGGSAD